MSEPMQNRDQIIKKGAKLTFEGAPSLEIRVNRVAKDGSWIDVFVYDNHTRTSWTKRQRLPLPNRWRVRGEQ